MSGWYLNYGMPEARVWECCSLEMQAEGKIALHQVLWPDARGGHFNFRPFEALADTDLHLTVGTDPRPAEKAGGLPAMSMQVSYTFTNPYTLVNVKRKATHRDGQKCTRLSDRAGSTASRGGVAVSPNGSLVRFSMVGPAV